uniref:Ribonuclease E n=1 Tax=Campylaephora sungminbooi TaxID=1896769 RepID=A0A1B0RRG0_9FLOR|nr:ribonuclease E [Campylaephora sungminbooi]AKU47338.1 ribonuclease E [Campylaephora sungminbooi]
MIKKIIISHFNNVAAILQNNKIQEIVVTSKTYQVNDIYIGVVQKIFSSINAAFIKLNKYGKSGFIHISDIKHLKRGKNHNHICNILSINQTVLVQVIKEPSLNKGPRLTANIHLYGKYVVLMPFCNTISISQKIYDDNERTYLYALAVLLKPRMMGVLIKQSAQGITESILMQDLDILKNQWFFIQKTAVSTVFPSLIYKDEDLIKKIVRDFYDDSIKKIIIDSKDGLKLLYYYLNKWNCISPITNIKLQLYNKPKCILEQFCIKQAIGDALKPKVKLISGGYIIIERSEALTVIDVNSGSFNKTDNSKEATLRTNFYAAIEITQQLKIRNINGVIIIDFIDMHAQRDQLQLLEHFSKLLKNDNARPQIVQLSELGLVELTRRRRGQSLSEVFGRIENTNSIFVHDIKRNVKPNMVVYRNISSLFFKKNFKKSIILNVKIFSPHSIETNYFFYIDKAHTIILFNPKANYIIPLFFYWSLVKLSLFY